MCNKSICCGLFTFALLSYGFSLLIWGLCWTCRNQCKEGNFCCKKVANSCMRVIAFIIITKNPEENPDEHMGIWHESYQLITL